jgi:hypothetical protein
MLHDLSDALAAKRHLTLPSAWRARRLHLPRGVVAHFADLLKKAIAWIGAIPVTTPIRTIRDCVAGAVPEDLVRQAVQQGVRRGLFERAEVQTMIREARGRPRDTSSKLSSGP